MKKIISLIIIIVFVLGCSETAFSSESEKTEDEEFSEYIYEEKINSDAEKTAIAEEDDINPDKNDLEDEFSAAETETEKETGEILITAEETEKEEPCDSDSVVQEDEVIVVEKYTEEAEDTAEIKSGILTENMSWNLTGGKLSITGSGEMPSFISLEAVPWNNYANEIISVVIGNDVSSIGDYAFAECSNLTYISIPQNIKSIGKCAFMDSGLASVDMAYGVITINDFAFDSCTNIESICIPDSVRSIGQFAFSDCVNMSKVTIGYDVLTIGECAFSGCGITELTIPDNVKIIESGAFSFCKRLVNVNINGNSIIHSYAFELCSCLQTVWIKTNSIQVSSYAFESCSNLYRIYFAGSSKEWTDLDIDYTGNDELQSADIYYDHKEHTCTASQRIEPTCIEKGRTSGTICSSCGLILSGCEEINASGHTLGEGIITKEPTAKEQGEKTFICSACGAAIKEKLPYKSGWCKNPDGTWSYNKEGKVAKGWNYINYNWFYMNYEGIMQTGWLRLENTWYYLNESGAMATGWLRLGNTWYYLNGNGAMATGWLRLGNTWYYLNESGAMATGWVYSNGHWYYMDLSGAMEADTTVYIGGKGYMFDDTGAWIK